MSWERLTASASILVIACMPFPVFAEILIDSPGFPATSIGEDGAIREEWGTVALRIVSPEGDVACEQSLKEGPVPTAVTTTSVGPVVLTQSVYRAPIWPGGVDVLTARLANVSGAPVDSVLAILLPEHASIGEEYATLGARPVLGLPGDIQPIRKARAWGCEGGVCPMPGWARPEGDCDPAYANISAGMGGVPIAYRFAVEPGAKRGVALGLCESHWNVGGQRPLVLLVEGAPKREIDPIGEWGQHGPGCLLFAAGDTDQDGVIKVVVAPHPRATDRNTILNAIWVFPPDVHLDAEAIMLGRMNDVAEHYVDVGGENDQSLYEGGTLRYELRLEPKSSRELCFLLASPEGGPVPNRRHMAWTPVALRKAAEEVWRDWPASQGVE